jgi:hypothetical protein
MILPVEQKLRGGWLKILDLLISRVVLGWRMISPRFKS